MSSEISVGRGFSPAAHAGPKRPAYIGLTLLFVVAFSATALACPICFRTDDAHVVNGVRAGVIVMMSVTASVLIAAGVFVHRIAKRQ